MVILWFQVLNLRLCKVILIRTNNQTKYGVHRVEYNVQRAMNTLSGSADKCLWDTSKKIAGTARNIDRWRSEVYLILDRVRTEISLLLSSEKKIRDAQTALGIICSISTECLERRSFRLETDLTLDPAQVELVKVRISQKTAVYIMRVKYI